MTSTFYGLETAKRGMFTQQSALSTTAHNVANANTAGYTRQRVNFVPTEPYPPVSKNSPNIPGQLGTGVKAGTVERVREGFLDIQYRNENNKLGYWDNRANALEKMEEIMNEPSDTGLSITMDRFWQSLQDLALDPTNAGARSVVRERGVALADTFNYLSTSLQSVQGDLKNELDISVKEINSLGTQISNINKQISEIEPHGYLPNDLYDERDRLIDQLSSLANIKVTNTASGGNAIAIAEGSVTIELVDDNGKSLGTLVDGSYKRANEFKIGYNADNGLVESVILGSTKMDVLKFNSTGKISSLIDSYGYTYESNNTVFEKGLFPDMVGKLDTMAFEFAKQFNDTHREGWSIEDYNNGAQTPVDFFSFGGTTLTDTKGASLLLQVSQDIINSTDHIAAAYPNSTGNVTIGNSANAIRLAEVKNSTVRIGNDTTTFQNYYEGIIGGMAVDAQEAERLTTNSQTLKDSVDTRRQSISAVSLDEEMTNMIQFQHAYNASARMITMQDEILDRIINGMGLSGR
ncbi:flagellar hook-associated protein 1 FlgK [Metabacillus crassostreae]|uniref:flagellar hook-associated protein FlgK n=1 Tax=Metabacillus crassostreae TaxID=929098 RepID=UPI001957FFFD|nr:flagellar hook-associated protein FlgK [Metabacillus crassostreae]MBM7606245.1 flagellar hook-associated protein 1 FlgK [Metabacillus crassostreae]